MAHFMVRVNISIAIVDMISTNYTNTTINQANKFPWNEHQKNDILGCFYWGLVLTSIPGGRLSEIYGTRIVLGIAMLMSSILTLLTPVACYLHYYCVIAIRFALGLALGVSWPAIPPLAIKWVAAADTSKFMAHTFACSIGAALTLPMCGYILAYINWQSVFYISGTICLLWTFFWFYLVYDSPEKHPRITFKEQEVIRREVGQNRHFEKIKTPWKEILSSPAVWAIIIADVCLQFNTNVVINELPTYMKEILHFNIKQNGLLSSLPYFSKYFTFEMYFFKSLFVLQVSYLAALLATYLADKWKKSEKSSTLTIRKFFTAISFLIPVILYLIQIVWGYLRVVSIVVFTLTLSFLCVSTAGFISNSMDISPTYSGTIFGLAYTGGSLTGYVVAKIVAFITGENATFELWRYVFWFLISVNLIGCITYCIFGSGKIQKWNPRSKIEATVKLTIENVPEEK